MEFCLGGLMSGWTYVRWTYVQVDYVLESVKLTAILDINTHL